MNYDPSAFSTPNISSRPTTGADVARAVGVSQQTVSRVMGGGKPVSRKTRELVLGVAKKMNYRPQAAGRAMRRGRTHTIGVLFAYQPVLHGVDHGSGLISAFSQALQGVGEALMRHRYHMSFVPLPAVDDATGGSLIPRMFLESSVDGVLVFQQPSNSMERTLENIGVRYVVLDGPSQENVFSVCVDEVRAAEMAVEHLVQHGHRRIAYVQEGLGFFESIQRVNRVEQFPRGYTLGMAKAGLPAMPGWDSPELVSEKLESLWQQDESPTALIAYDVQTARTINAWLNQRGLSVPKDVSVVALHHTGGDVEWSGACMPRLTCKANQQMQMAEIVVEKLLHLLKHPDEDIAKSIVLEPKLVIRDSSGPCR